MSTALTKSENSLYKMITSPETANKLKMQMASHVTPERLTRVAWGAMMKTPKLMQATPESVMYCIAECARIGLEPALGRVYFIPFDNTDKKTGAKKTECQFIIGYQGLMDLARRSGIVSSINARCVYENEKFTYFISVEAPEMRHEPMLVGEKGKLLGAYCIARFKDGGSHVEWMTKGEIDKIRERSKAKNSGPWVSDYDAMALKTVIRRAAKFWPLTTASPEFADALTASDEEILDVEFEEQPEKPSTNRESVKSAIKKTTAKKEPEPEVYVPDEEEDAHEEPEAQSHPDDSQVDFYKVFLKKIETASSNIALKEIEKGIEVHSQTGELLGDEVSLLIEKITDRREALKKI